MDDSMTDCLCGHSYDSEQFMIECDICKKWYHGVCVSVKEYMSIDLDKYHCPRCESSHGASVSKVRMNWHRHDYSEPEADSKPVQTGTPVFIRELKSRNFPKADEVVVKQLRGQQLTLQYLEANGFENPIIIDSKEGLDMTVPPSNFSVYDVESYIGGEREMDVIDVTRQSNVRMKLRDFVEYYNEPTRTRVLNVISLEFSNTGLSTLVEAPYIARKLDWVNSVWPRELIGDNEFKRPEVQKYCLMGVKDSYTDFHIDFGGTSVWYHVLKGEKIFYLIKPTVANIQLYHQWMSSSSQSETFFGDQADACYKCVLKQGQTMMIPTGWIHAVLTPIDSLVFGGNFIHSLNIPMQIQIYELERKMKTPAKYQYPGFETIHWLAAKKLLKELKDLNHDGKKCPEYFLHGVKALLAILKQWNTDKDYSTLSRAQIPHIVNSQKLLKDLSKEIRNAERYLMVLNPPKPERESKRKKKKPINKDFIDFATAAQKVTDNNAFRVKSLNKVDGKTPHTRNIELIKKPSIKKKSIKLKLPKNVINLHNSGKTDFKNLDKRKKQDEISRLTKPGKQSPTVIRFKLGDNEVVRSTNDKVDVYANFSIDPSIETQKEFTWKQSSIYDFHDGSNESDHAAGTGFTIDEEPKRNKKSSKKSKKFVEKNNHEISSNDAPRQNGFEELLKASAYALSSSGARIETPAPQPQIGSGRTSPSTCEAIAGMLSFSEQCYSTETGASNKKSASKNRNIEYDRGSDGEDDQSIENIDKVHQDDDFIYPALDASDDEEYIFKPRGKRCIDEAWNPKARVGPLLPKTNRPAREGVKKTSVEKGLEAAAAKRAKLAITTKRLPKKKKNDVKESTDSVTVKPTSSLQLTSNNNATSSPAASIISYTSILTSPNRLKDVKAKLAAPIPIERKPKKGMKTAKQRLGKILKLHKMMH